MEHARDRLVFLTGELGMGKTALLEAFAQRIVPREHYWIARGSGVESYGVGEPYLPFLAALGSLARGDDAPAITALLRHAAPTWLALMPWLASPTERALLARELLRATMPQMLRELAEILDTLARQRPLILFLDDMHWGDQASIAALAYPRPAPATRPAAPARGLPP